MFKMFFFLFLYVHIDHVQQRGGSSSSLKSNQDRYVCIQHVQTWPIVICIFIGKQTVCNPIECRLGVSLGNVYSRYGDYSHHIILFFLFYSSSSESWRSKGVVHDEIGSSQYSLEHKQLIVSLLF